jgi:hypothetical protein
MGLSRTGHREDFKLFWTAGFHLGTAVNEIRQAPISQMKRYTLMILVV